VIVAWWQLRQFGWMCIVVNGDVRLMAVQGGHSMVVY
jgi:hypothetical protein